MLLVDDRFCVQKVKLGMELPVRDPLTNVLAPECWTKNTGTSLLWARSDEGVDIVEELVGLVGRFR